MHLDILPFSRLPLASQCTWTYCLSSASPGFSVHLDILPFLGFPWLLGEKCSQQIHYITMQHQRWRLLVPQAGTGAMLLWLA